MSHNWILDPKGSSQEEVGRELERVTWHPARAGGKLPAAGKKPQNTLLMVTVSVSCCLSTAQAQRSPMQGLPSGQHSAHGVGPDSHWGAPAPG